MKSIHIGIEFKSEDFERIENKNWILIRKQLKSEIELAISRYLDNQYAMIFNTEDEFGIEIQNYLIH